MKPQVDLIALTRAENAAARKLVALQAWYGSMPPDDEYWKTIIEAAAPLFRLGGVEEGLKVLAIVPPAYLRGKLREHMATDVVFAEAARTCADALVESGRVHIQPLIVDTKKLYVGRQGEA